jgi:hypothetical protein
MLKPTVHMNGTSAEELIKQLRTARRAMQAAFETLREASPNARDYYPQGGVWGAVQDEWDARFEKVRSVIEDLTLMEESVYEQKKERER